MFLTKIWNNFKERLGIYDPNNLPCKTCKHFKGSYCEKQFKLIDGNTKCSCKSNYDNEKDFKVGDVVKVKHDAPFIITPFKLVEKKGYKNEFHIKEVTILGNDEFSIRLKECCGVYDRHSGYYCTGHPAEYFEKIGDKK